MKHTHKAIVLSSLLTPMLIVVMGFMVAGINPLAPFASEQKSFVAVPQAEAWGGSTWRRIRREARRTRDNIRKELERARQHAERETKRAATRVREGDLHVSLDTLERQALTYLSTATAATPFLPVSQIVQLSLAALEYERVVQDMEALDMDQSELSRAEQQLNRYEQTVNRLENVRVDPNVRIGLVPTPAGTVQSAEMARVQYEQLGQYLAVLVFESALYEHVQGEIPRRRPVTLIYKIGQGLLDYAQLTADIRLIADTQPEHANLYNELVTRGSVGSVVSLLTRSLTYLETMPVSGLPDPEISPTSRVGRLLNDADTLMRSGDQIIAQSYAFPLMVTPTQTLTNLNAKIQEMTHDRRRPESAWILLLPQHEVDALDEARIQLQRKRDQIAEIHIYTPQELVSRFFLEALILWPRYQQLGPQEGGKAAALYLEIREIRTRLQNAVNTVQDQHLSFPSNLMTTVRSALQNLERAETDLSQRTSSFMQGGSTSSVASLSSSSSRSLRPSAPATMGIRSSRNTFMHTKWSFPTRSAQSSMKSTTSSLRFPILPTRIQSSQQSKEQSSVSQSSKTVSSVSSVSSFGTSLSSVISSSANTADITPSATTLPAPRITDPAQSTITVTVSKIDVYGLVDNRTQQLLVNGKPSTSYTPTSGKFWITLNLVLGQNVFELQAVDGAGVQSAITTLTVNYNTYNRIGR